MSIHLGCFDDFDFPTEKLTKVDEWFYGENQQDFIYYERRISKRLKVWDKLLVTALFDERTLFTVTPFCSKYKVKARGSLQELYACVENIKNLWKGTVTVHGSCMAKDGEAILFPAMPSTGKTLSCLQLLSRGYSFMADDTLQVDSNSYAHANLNLASAVGTYILPYENTLSTCDKWNLKIRSWLRQFPGATKLVKPFMGKAWQLVKNAETTDKAKIRAVCILEKGPTQLKKLSKEETVNKMTAIDHYSLPQPFNNPVLNAYVYFNPRLNFSILERLKYGLLRRLVTDFDTYLASCNNGEWASLLSQI